MNFIEKQGNITINGTFSCPIEIFKVLEPTYEGLPAGYDQRIYIPQKQHTLLSSEGYQTINLETTWKDGDRYISRIEEFVLLKNYILRDEIETQILISQELLRRIPYSEKRKCEYPSIDLLVIAMWEHLVEKKTKKESGVTEIQYRRDHIKKKYPKD